MYIILYILLTYKSCLIALLLSDFSKCNFVIWKTSRCCIKYKDAKSARTSYTCLGGK